MAPMNISGTQLKFARICSSKILMVSMYWQKMMAFSPLAMTPLRMSWSTTHLPLASTEVRSGLRSSGTDTGHRTGFKLAGWLQTSRKACIIANTRPLRAKAAWAGFSPAALSAMPANSLSCTALYNEAWPTASSQSYVCSTLSGKSAAMFGSVLRRRMTNGWIMRCRSLCFSGPVPAVIGLENSLSNSAREFAKYPGKMNSNWLCRSESLFSTGVPLKATRVLPMASAILFTAFEI
mmetsp:Transcript_579/g.2428  ORF Transcript_579/g.2428 Transcript_579/m.2428 type:complete len:236 (+) Transcript_579:634-1341(+)